MKAYVKVRKRCCAGRKGAESMSGITAGFQCLVCLLLFGWTGAQEPHRFDVVIHELFADPAPPVGLPVSEFIELRNTSPYAFNLRNWKISDGSSTAVIIVNYMLQPDSVVVVCPSGAVAAFSVFGAVIGVAGFPSLNNDGDMIVLSSSAGSIIHSIEYDLQWYRNAVKSDGGWTLEMMDAHNPCGSANNWSASIDAMGGTPGRYNSIERDNPDLQPPALLRTYTVDSVTIGAVFDEPLDSSAAGTVNHYQMDKGVMIANAIPAFPTFGQVYLKLATALSPGTVYTLLVSDVADCSGNSIGMMNTARAGLPSETDASAIVINELLFNPLPTGTDYVEIFNRGNKVIDASTLFISSRNITGILSTPRKLSEVPFLVFPGDYIVATENAVLVKANHTVPEPMNVLVVPQLPSFPDEKGNVVLLNRHGTVIDELWYDEQWHFPLIANREGISLERIDHGLPTQDKDNWTSAASDAGYGTPTYRNSQYKTSPSLLGKLEVRPAVFSPDGDGRDDLCFIYYQFPTANNVASVTVFDVNGIVVRNLYRNVTLSEKGAFRWDGLDDKGNRLTAGVYIVLAELFSLDGNKKNFKNPVTLAYSF